MFIGSGPVLDAVATALDGNDGELRIIRGTDFAIGLFNNPLNILRVLKNVFPYLHSFLRSCVGGGCGLAVISLPTFFLIVELSPQF